MRTNRSRKEIKKVGLSPGFVSIRVIRGLLSRQKPTRPKTRQHAECVRVANLVLGDHAANFQNRKCATVQNRFRFVTHIIRAWHDRSRQKEVTALIRESRRRK